MHMYTYLLHAALCYSRVILLTRLGNSSACASLSARILNPPLPKQGIYLHVACRNGRPAILFSPKLWLAVPSPNARQVGNSNACPLFLSYPRVTPELPPQKGIVHKTYIFTMFCKALPKKWAPKWAPMWAPTWCRLGDPVRKRFSMSPWGPQFPGQLRILGPSLKSGVIGNSNAYQIFPGSPRLPPVIWEI